MMFTLVLSLATLGGVIGALLPSDQIHSSRASCACGAANLGQDKIVGGTEVSPHHKYPWQALLEINVGGTFICGGTLINKKFVITAMHCITGAATSNLKVGLGTHFIPDTGIPAANQSVVAKIHKRSDYNHTTMDNDIAILELQNEVVFSNIISPACLPTAGNDFAGVNATVSGYGDLQSGGSPSQNLMEVQLPVLSDAACTSTVHGNSLTDNMMCAGFAEGGKDACQGDSGGPLTTPINGKYTLIGVVSFGDGCANPNSPGVFVRVTNYLDWINDVSKSGNC